MSYTILIADDDNEFREELRDFFEGYNVVEASNALEAVNILKKPNEIDLVLLDVMMPGKRGTEVVKTIKAISPKVSIIILTGCASKEIAVEALRGHVDDFIEKPLNSDKIKKIEDFLAAQLGADSIPGDGKKSKIERVRRYLERNFDKKVTLSDAAKAIAVSPKYLSRLFKEVLSMGFNDYRLECKIQKAKEMLVCSDYNVDQIAYKLGYENTSSFVRIFKMLTKRTPSEYRARSEAKKKNVKR